MKVSTDDEFISKMAIFHIDPVLTHEPFWFWRNQFVITHCQLLKHICVAYGS